MRKFFIGFFMVIGLSLLYAGGKKDTKSLVVGGKNYTEQYLLSEMISLILEKNGFEVEQKVGLSSSAVHAAMLQKQIDIYADFTGTAWSTWLEHTEKSPGAEQLFQQIKKEDLQKSDTVWLGPFVYNNTYALALKKEEAERLNIVSLSDLSTYINSGQEVSIAVDSEFFERPDGIFSMIDAYNININRRQVLAMETGLTYLALDANEVDVAMVYTTDGRLKKFNLQVLEDDRSFFPPYNAAVLIRKEVLENYPEIESFFEPIYSLLDEQTMIDLNYQIDAEKKEAKDVATAFLRQHSLLDS